MRNTTNAIRYRKLGTKDSFGKDQWSVRIDYYVSNGKGGHDRKVRTLGINVTQDYTKKRKFAPEDEAKIELARGVLADYNLKKSQKVNDYEVKKEKSDLKFLPYLSTYAAKKNDSGATRIYSRIKKYAGENLMMSDMNFVWFEDFQKYLRSKVGQNTEHRYLYKLKQVLNYAVKIDVIDKHNFNGIKIPGVADTDKTTLTIEEVKLLANTPVDFKPHVKQGFLFACCTGLRVSDVRKLEWKELRGNKIKFRPKKTSAKILELPLSVGALKILEGIEKSNTTDKVFYDLPSDSKIRTDLIKWGELAGIDKRMHFHASRHTFATIGLTFGIDIYTMQTLLGHSKITQTTVYAKIVDKKKDAEIAKFPTL
jgi:integrase